MSTLDNPDTMDGWDLERAKATTREAIRSTNPQTLITVTLAETYAKTSRDAFPRERWRDLGEFLLYAASAQGALVVNGHRMGADMHAAMTIVNITGVAGLLILDAADMADEEDAR